MSPRALVKPKDGARVGEDESIARRRGARRRKVFGVVSVLDGVDAPGVQPGEGAKSSSRRNASVAVVMACAEEAARIPATRPREP